MATIHDSVANAIAALLMPLEEYYSPEVSALMSQIKLSESVPMRDYLGKNWKIIWPIAVGVSGATEFSAMAGPNIATTPGTQAPVPPGFQLFQDLETYPGLSESPIPSIVQMEVQLKRQKINLLLPIQLFESDELDATKMELIETIVTGFVQNLLQFRANIFLSQNDTNVKGIIGKWTQGGTAGAIGTTGHTITGTPTAITLDSYTTAGAFSTSIQKFAPGQRVDIWTTAGVKVNTNGPVFVDSPDPYGTSTSMNSDNIGTLQLYYFGGGSLTITNAVTYYITPRNVQNHPNSLDQMLITTGTLPFGPGGTGLSVDSFPQLKSLVRDVNAPLSDPTLLRLFARSYYAHPGSRKIKNLWSTPGVWAALFQDMLTLGAGSPVRFERNGSIMQYKGGMAESPTFSLFGAPVGFKTDVYIPQGVVYGLDDSPDNYQMVRSPGLPGAGKDSRFPGFDFLGQLYGNRSTILPYNQVGGAEAGAITNFMQMPASMPWEVLPRKCISGMKLLRCKEFYG